MPWLRDHFMTEIGALADATDLDPTALLRRLRAVASSLRGGGEGGLSLLEAVQTDAQRVVLDRLTGLMSLLEGHAEYVMDGVGPQVVPSVTTIRARFDERRGGGSAIQRVLRRLLGIDLKLRQYADGSRLLNRVWESPETLPSRAEIAEPTVWLDRVLDLRPSATA